MSDFDGSSRSSERSNEVDGGILAFFGKLAFRLVLGFVRLCLAEAVTRWRGDADRGATGGFSVGKGEERMLDGGISVREGVTAAALWCAGGLLFFRVVGFAGR
ncbi:hypothetical protein HAX54_038521 [Datura stramonium]|uniref:Uncharacterized protein n=1 Tax=Datura stramonium TaxID=4076 RepID=A0ABS8Y9C8_DATST|nr:hypothetical protein [Datura stramonium]